MRYTRNVLFITKDNTYRDTPFQVNGKGVFSKGEQLDFTVKPHNLEPYSANYIVGDLVRVKTRKEFEKHFRVTPSTYSPNRFKIEKICFGFTLTMSDFSGRTLGVIEAEDGRYRLKGGLGFYFHSDMLIRASSLYKEI